jgi:hypothetical protein
LKWALEKDWTTVSLRSCEFSKYNESFYAKIH